MEFKEKKEDGVLTVAPIGQLDYPAATEFKNYMSDKFEKVDSLIIDLEDVPYTSSAGLRVIFELDLLMKKRKGMKLINVSDEIKEVLHVAKFDRFLNIE